MIGFYLFSSERQIPTSVKLYERMLVEVLVTGLNEVGLRLQVVILRLVELCDGSFAILVLSLHQFEGILRTMHSLLRGFLFRLSIQGVVIHLLNLFIQFLLCVVEGKLLILLIDTGIANVIACLETVEDRHIQIHTNIL